MVDWFSIFRRKVDARTPSRKHTEETAAEDVERSCKYPNEESSMLESENGNEIPQDYCSHGNGGQIELCKENDDTGIKMEKEETATKKCGCCRTRRGRIKILVWTLVGLSVTFLILVIVISSGMLYEQAQVRKAEQAFNSLGLYTTNRVCGILQPEEQPLRIQTYDNVSQVLALQANGTNVTVAHCGDCGHCSNPQGRCYRFLSGMQSNFLAQYFLLSFANIKTQISRFTMTLETLCSKKVLTVQRKEFLGGTTLRTIAWSITSA